LIVTGGFIGTAASIATLNIEGAGVSSVFVMGGGLLAYGGFRVLIHNECIPDFLK